MIQHSKKAHSESYDALAEIYDQVMDHVDYKQWTRYVRSVFSAHVKNVQDIIDLSCGTGSFLAEMRLKNAKIIGCDLSSEMIQQAIRKSYKLPSKFIVTDFLNTPFKAERFDVALALYDSVNYLLAEEQVSVFLSEAFRVLKPGGVLIFDAVTPYVCKTVFKDYYESQEIEKNTAYARRSWYDAAERIQYNDFRIELEGRDFEELHEQKIWSIRDWKRFIKKSPFVLEAVYANFTFRPIERKSERAHFICIKAQNNE